MLRHQIAIPAMRGGYDGAQAQEQKEARQSVYQRSKELASSLLLPPLCGFFKFLNDINGLMTALATVALACLTLSLKDLAGKQEKIISDQLKVAQIDQRPWITARKIEAEKPAGRDKFSFRLIIRNIGKTTTTGFYVGAKTVERSELDAESTRLCEAGRAEAANKPRFWRKFSIITGDDFSIDDVGPDIRTSFNRSDFKNPEIAGCVIYGSMFDALAHQTIFHAEVEVGPDGATVPNIFTMDAD